MHPRQALLSTSAGRRCNEWPVGCWPVVVIIQTSTPSTDDPGSHITPGAPKSIDYQVIVNVWVVHIQTHANLKRRGAPLPLLWGDCGSPSRK